MTFPISLSLRWSTNDAVKPAASKNSFSCVTWFALLLQLQGIAMVPKGRMFVVGCTDGDVFAFEAKVSRDDDDDDGDDAFSHH